MLIENYKERISAMKVFYTATLSNAAKAIADGLLGTAIVIEPDTDRFIGVLTDGDIRRALLNKYDGDSLISKFVRDDAVVGRVDMAAEEITKLFTSAVRVIPILDDKDNVVDLAVFDKRMHLPIAETYFDDTEVKYVNECISSGWVSSSGKFITQFEKVFSDFLGTKHAVSCSNGTSALHLALKAFDIGPGDEVIVPALTFIATASAVSHAGAKPVFVDSEVNYFNMDPNLIEGSITSKTKAIIPVHLYGHPVDMDPILDIARKHGFIIIEDAAEAHGALYKGKKVGSLGDAGIFSFFGNKVVTTGEGGMIATNSKKISNKIKLLRDHGMDRSRGYWHPILGFNYRITNLQAALGVAQMEKIDKIIHKKTVLAKNYSDQLKNIPGVTIPKEARWAKHIFWLYTILIDENKLGIKRDELIKKLKGNKIDARPTFIPMHQQPIFENGQKLPVAEKLSQQGLSLPSYVNIKEKDQFRICETIRTIILSK